MFNLFLDDVFPEFFVDQAMIKNFSKTPQNKKIKIDLFGITKFKKKIWFLVRIAKESYILPLSYEYDFLVIIQKHIQLLSNKL